MAAAVGHSLSAKLSGYFDIDTRTLALFRVVLGALLLFDGIARVQQLGLHYTDSGIVPLATRGVFETQFSFHWISGSFAFQAVLFGAYIATATALLVGYRTRVAAFVCWLLLTSLQFRSPYLNNGGDSIGRMLLLWSIFLPLATRFSFDARRATTAVAARVLSPATVAILIQLVLFYLVAGLSKSGETWLDGSAVAVALDNSFKSRALGDALLEFPAVLEFFTYAARGLEIFGPALLFVPVFTAQFRVLMILAFASLQIGLGTSLDLHLFPFFSIAASLVFVPSWFWDRFFPATQLEAPSLERAGAGQAPRRNAWEIVESAFVITLIAASVMLAAGPAGVFPVPQALRKPARFIGFEQAWTMYAPNPPAHDFQYQILGHQGDEEPRLLLASNQEVDHGAAWGEIVELHNDGRLRRHLERLVILQKRVEPLRQSYLAWMCRSWNRAHPNKRILHAAFIGISRPTLAGPEAKEKSVLLAERTCQRPRQKRSRSTRAQPRR